MARMTKREEAEYVTVYYGIHAETGTVRSVWQTRGGKLNMGKNDGSAITAVVGPGRRAENELVIVFGLSDVFSVPVGLMDGEGTKRRVADLEAKAATQREAKAAAKKVE